MEKRRAIRYQKRLKVMFGPHETINFGFLVDISKTGLKVNTNNIFKPGTQLKLNILNGDSDAVMLAEGSVAWAKKATPNSMRMENSGMGIKLLRIDPILRRFYDDLQVV